MNKREKNLLYACAVVVAITAAVNYLVVPAAGNYRRTIRQIRLLQASLIKSAQYNNLLAFAQPAGAKQDASVEVLSRLENFARSANIRIVDVRPQTVAGGPSTGEIAVELKVEGSLDGYAGFIHNIENPLSLLSIKTIQLRAKPASRTLEGTLLIYGFPAAG